MKKIIVLGCVTLALGWLAGCATANSDSTAITGAPQISGYVDTSTQKHF